MAYGLNKAQIIGHLGKDPELKYTDGGVAVVKFTVATNESYKTQDGNRVDKTEWHNVVAWRKLAEVMGQFLKKGSKVYLEGKLQTSTWDDKEGVKHYKTEIVAEEFVFLDAKGEGAGSSYSEPPSSNSTSFAPPAVSGKEEDLPF
jgi:single-strand DNA-binding protein